MNFDEIRPCWLEIDLDHLDHNLRVIREHLKPDSEIMAVVKANAYNHGAVTVARELQKRGVSRFCVSILSEGLELRQAGIQGPVLLLNYVRDSEIKEAIREGLTMTVYDMDQAKRIEAAAEELGIDAKVHIKLDTGMSRIGFLPGDVALERIQEIIEMPHIDADGIYTHFATADMEDGGQTHRQFEVFSGFVARLEERIGRAMKKHVSNSAAIMDYDTFDLDFVRPGIILYGFPPSEAMHARWDLKPLMTLKALISNLKVLPEGRGISYGHSYVTRRITKVATIPLGYADGISRMLSNKLEVTIKGKRAPSIGLICMDQFMVDVTDIDDVAIGDEVVIFGRREAGVATLSDMAKAMGTIHYEVMCMISRRIPRVYVRDGKPVEILNYV